jgi:protein gp37
VREVLHDRDCPRHIFQFLTRHPQRYLDWVWWQNCWLGATATTAQAAYDCGEWLGSISWGDSGQGKTFLSCEPLLSWSPPRPALHHLDWIIVGAMTGPGAIPPEDGAVERLIESCDLYSVPIFCKRSVRHICKRQEWPEGVTP